MKAMLVCEGCGAQTEVDVTSSPGSPPQYVLPKGWMIARNSVDAAKSPQRLKARCPDCTKPDSKR